MFRKTLILVSLALFTWQSYLSIRRFYNGNISVAVNLVYGKRPPFPRLSFCPVYSKDSYSASSKFDYIESAEYFDDDFGFGLLQDELAHLEDDASDERFEQGMQEATAVGTTGAKIGEKLGMPVESDQKELLGMPMESDPEENNYVYYDVDVDGGESDGRQDLFQYDNDDFDYYYYYRDDDELEITIGNVTAKVMPDVAKGDKRWHHNKFISSAAHVLLNDTGHDTDYVDDPRRVKAINPFGAKGARYWHATIGMYNDFGDNIQHCLTYTPRKSRAEQQLNEYTERVVFRVDTRKARSLYVFVHDPSSSSGDPYLSLTSDFGTSVVLLPEIAPKNRTRGGDDDNKQRVINQGYLLETTLHHVLPKTRMPCYKDDEEAIPYKDCIEAYVESNIENCALPWRTCRIDHLKDIPDLTPGSNKYEVYYATKCYHKCTFPEYKLVKIYDEEDKNGLTIEEAGYTVQFDLSLSSSPLREETEEVAYDLNNMMGDVGGVLGLLLGASAVSLYDAGKDWLRRKKKRYRFEPLAIA